ncbi:MAG TPA: YbjN domain-containing protein [Bauldia sp.]|nr:YbjN domain-containing protein [Bauldia sp.]
MGIWATPVRTAGLFLASSLTIGALSDLAWGEGQKGPGGANSNSAQNSDSDATDMIDATDPQSIADELWLYDGVEVLKDGDGNPKIDVNDQSAPFTVFFHGCTDGKDCTYIEFDTWWDLKNGVQASVVDKWNQTKLWGVAYRDEHGDPHLSMTVNLRYGVSLDNFDDTLDWWDTATGQFEDAIGWKKK